MNQNKSLWDPFVGSISADTLTSKNTKNQKKLDKYNQNPHLPIRNLMLLAVPGIAVLGFMVIGSSFFFEALSIPPNLYIFAVFLSFAPVLFYYGIIHNLERDLVKLLVAQENQWHYNPDEQKQRWKQALAKFPDFFNNGNQGQNLQDEYWGQVEGVNFYQSIFRYQRRTGHGKNRKTRTYHTTIFAFKLPKKIKNEFRLMPPSLGGWSLFKTKKQTLDTESHAFNKFFKVTYNNQTGAEALNIVQTLSPALIEKLTILAQNEQKASVYFKNDVVIFKFRGRLLPRMKTNFFKKVELDSRDQHFIENRIKKLLKISQEMLQYLD